MNDNNNKTLSMLQRVPLILAVTAASYGLPLQAQSAPSRASARQVLSRPAASHVAPQPRLVQQR
jgi:hypothetical protein